MKTRYLLPLFVLGSSFYMVTDYSFVKPGEPVHLAGQYRDVGKAKFRSPHSVKGSHEKYMDAFANAYVSHYLTPNNSLTWHAGWSFIHFDWPKNPRFRADDYNFAAASLAWVSTSIKDWRWILSAATSVEADSFNFGQTGVYYGMMWGRYQFLQNVGLHIGGFGYYGVRGNGYLLPIIGFDWQPTRQWLIAGIFPMHAAIEYYFSPNWSVCAQGSAFGGPYRFPIRARQGISPFEHAIFEIFATGIEGDLKFSASKVVAASIGGGWNFGGWILIKDHHSHHGRYYKFDGAPYVQAQLKLTF